MTVSVVLTAGALVAALAAAVFWFLAGAVRFPPVRDDIDVFMQDLEAWSREMARAGRFNRGGAIAAGASALLFVAELGLRLAQ